MNIAIAVGIALGFSTLISFIEVLNRSKSHLKACFTSSFFLYWLILGVGNTATTFLAVSPVQRLFNHSNGDEVSQSVPALENSSTPEEQPTQSPEPTPTFTPIKPLGGSVELSGAIWFWYAFIGVFGFEILLKNINLTFANVGVLSINDWISKALDNAEASAIEAQTNLDTEQAQTYANVLKSLSDSELNAQVLNSLGSDRLTELENNAQNSSADPNLTKALALAYEDPDKAAAIYQSLM